jgi:RNA recognition motif-containing protein
MRIIKKKPITYQGLFIKNINIKADINDIDIFLTNYLDKYDNLIMLKNNFNNFNGKIVIIFNNEQLAKQAMIKLNNVVFFNRKLKVTYAFKKYLETNNNNDKSLINLFTNNLNLI